MKIEKKIRSEKSVLLYETFDFSHSKEKFSVYWNEKREIGYTFPMPKDVWKYYPKTTYLSYKHKEESLFGKVYFLAQKIMFFYKKSILSPYISNKKILLDFGSGSGNFSTYMRRFVKQSIGIERNNQVENSREIHRNWDKIKEHSIDIITAWHVMEHILNLEKEINTIKSKLKSGGILLIAVPNINSHDAKHYKKYWAALDTPRHLWHFSKGGIQKLFSLYEFSLVSTTHLPLDVFYIAILSEKNKGTPLYMLIGMLKAIRFFLKNLFTCRPSSIVFLFKNA